MLQEHHAKDIRFGLYFDVYTAHVLHPSEVLIVYTHDFAHKHVRLPEVYPYSIYWSRII